MSSSGHAAAEAMPITPSSSSHSQKPAPHVSISPKSLAEKPHPQDEDSPHSPPVPKSPMPPTASLGTAGSAIMDPEGSTSAASGSTLRGTGAAASTLQATDGSTSAASSTQIPSPPPEVEATLSKLTAHANVTGVLVLSRPEALVIRSGGSYFEPSGTGASDRAIRLKSVVNLVRNAVLGLERDVPKAEAGDDLCFLRIRTKKYEMMVSPSEKYLLVVLQDPTAGS